MSAKPTLYYVPDRAPVRAVLLVAKAIGLELDLKFVNLVGGEQLEPWFIALNPQHTVPTLVDNGRSLWDSHAISTYLIGKYGGSDDHPLYPRDFYTRAHIDQRLHFDTGVVLAQVLSIIGDIFYRGSTGPNEQQVAGGHSAYDMLETFLVKDPYLVGNQLTVADLLLITSVTQLDAFVPLDAAKYPKIAAWIVRLEQLPYFHETNTVNLVDFVTWIKGVMKSNAEAKK